MQFGLSEEQILLAETLRRYLDEECPVTRVRELVAPGGPEPGEARTLWKDLAGLGAAGILVPEEHGGSGLGMLDAAVAAEAFGWGVAPVPFLATSVLAPVALRGADAEVAARWLPAIATGECLVGVAAADWVARPGAPSQGVEVRDGRLHGRSLMAIDAGEPDLWLVATTADAARLALVEGGAAGLACETMATIDRTRRFGELALDAVEPVGWAAVDAERLLTAGRVALCADLLGATDRAIALAVAYAKQRVQFDRVIASFQAVKHMCAEMVAELEPARSLSWYAAHAFDEAPDEAALVTCQAKAHLSEVGTVAVRTATEVHGGIGFTDEQNLHFWFKRVGVDRQIFGTPERLRAEAAALQGWGAVA